MIGKWIYLFTFMSLSLLHARTKVMGILLTKSYVACGHIHEEILIDGQVRMMGKDKGSQLHMILDLLCHSSDPQLHL